jgi:ribosomal protein S18 acetylase RimI-like enzyme
MFAGWGHLDRIAVAPRQQGEGRGRDALALAIAAMRHQGAARIALSTQLTNLRSQRLYERCGFRRTPELDYRLFGAWCQAPRHVVSTT